MLQPVLPIKRCPGVTVSTSLRKCYWMQFFTFSKWERCQDFGTVFSKYGFFSFTWTLIRTLLDPVETIVQLSKDLEGLTHTIPIFNYSHTSLPNICTLWHDSLETVRDLCPTSNYCLIMGRAGLEPISVSMIEREDAPWISHQLIRGLTYRTNNHVHTTSTPEVRCKWDP